MSNSPESWPSPGDPTSIFRLDGKVAVVTGASSGLGHRFARVLHAAGASVVMAARRKERLDELAAALGERALAVECDVSDEAARERLIAEATAVFGGVDVLVNNAGIGTAVALEDEAPEVFDATWQVNVKAVWHLSKLCAPIMAARGGGSIVNIASILGHVAGAPIKQANYAASKGAVVNLTRELGVQLARRKVRVNALCPGYFVSEMTTVMQTDESSQKYLRQNCPMPRIGEEHELDGAILLLASDASTYMTGQSLVVDGGWLAR